MEPLRPTDPDAVGSIGLRGRLGQGGMGTVFYGITEDGEPVAVKMISAEHLEKPEALDRFEREALAMGMVQGPRVRTSCGHPSRGRTRRGSPPSTSAALTSPSTSRSMARSTLASARHSASASRRRSWRSTRRASCIVT